jgi:hypothetical protein
MPDFYEDDTPDVYDDTFYNNPGQPLIGAASRAAPVMEPGPMIPEPFTTADQLHLQKLEQSLAHVRMERGVGNIDERTAARLSANIERLRQPLKAAEHQAKQQAQSEMQQQVIQQAAQAQGMEHSNALFRIRGLNDRIMTRMGPNGEPQEWYEESPNVLKMVPSAQGTGPAGAPGQAPTEEESAALSKQSVDFTGFPGMGNVLQAVPEIKPNGDGTHTMTIYNGANRTEVKFAQDPSSPSGYRAAGTTNYDASGKEIIPHAPKPTVAAPNADGSLSDAQRAEIGQKAIEGAGREPPQFWNGRPNSQHTQWQRHVAANQHRMEQEQINLNLARVKGGIVTAEHQRRAAEKRKSAYDAADDLKITPEATAKMIQGEENDLADKDKGGSAKVGGGKVMHDEEGNVLLADNGAEVRTTPDTKWHAMSKYDQQAEADRRVRRRLQHRRDENAGETKAAAAGVSTVPPGTPAQPEQPKAAPKKLEPNQFKKSDIEAAIRAQGGYIDPATGRVVWQEQPAAPANQPGGFISGNAPPRGRAGGFYP